jgi:hypothetical protein
MDAIIWQMIADGATLFTEVGPGKVLAGLIAKIDKKLLQMRNCTSVSVFVFNFTYSINQTFLLENHLYKRKFMEVFFLLSLRKN